MPHPGRSIPFVDPGHADSTRIPTFAIAHAVATDMSIGRHRQKPPCAIRHDRTRIPIGCGIMANFIA